MLGTKGETKVMRHFIVSVVVALTFAFSASTASAYSTTMTYAGADTLAIDDTITVTVDFDSEGAASISLLSVSVLFDSSLVVYLPDASTSPSYALYVSGGKGNQYLVPATTNLTLRTGTNDQILLDWQNTALPGGNRDPGTFQMAQLVFLAIGNGLADFVISNSSPGNVLQLADGSNPPNNISGDFDVQIPEPTAASLSIFALLSLAGLKLRTRRQ